MTAKWIKDLERMFFPENAHDLKIDAAMGLLYNNLPSRLFKYREIDEYSLKNLKEDTVWCSNAKDFNDPYDSAICFDLVNNFFDNKIMQHLIDFAGHDPEINLSLTNEMKELLTSSENVLDSMIDFAESQTEEIVTPEMKDELKNAILVALGNEEKKMHGYFNERLQNGFKICSFSQRIDSTLMWSHYASKHKGFAIEYNFSSLPDSDMLTRSLWPVIYDDQLLDGSKYFLTLGDNNRLNPFFGIFASMHKAKDWEYEQEWRIILPLGSDLPPQSYNVPKPRAIYLGSRITQNDQQKLCEIAQMRNIDVYKMALAHNRFKMVGEKLP